MPCRLSPLCLALLPLLSAQVCAQEGRPLLADWGSGTGGPVGTTRPIASPNPVPRLDRSHTATRPDFDLRLSAPSYRDEGEQHHWQERRSDDPGVPEEGTRRPAWLPEGTLSLGRAWVATRKRGETIEELTTPVSLTLDLDERLSLTLGAQGYNFREPQEGLATSLWFSASGLIVKQGRVDPAWLPSVRLTLAIDVPIGEAEFRPDGDGVVPWATLAFTWKLPAGFEVAALGGLRVLEDQDERHFGEVVASLRVSRPLSERVEAHVACLSRASGLDRSQVWLAAAAGLSVQITPRVKIGAALKLGLTEVTPRYQACSGVSLSF